MGNVMMMPGASLTCHHHIGASLHGTARHRREAIDNNENMNLKHTSQYRKSEINI